MKQSTTSDRVRFLDIIGFRWYDHGNVAKGKVNLFDYYKGDTLTQIQRDKLKERFGDEVEFMKSSPQYAPEIVKPIVLFAKAAMIRQIRAEKAASLNKGDFRKP